MASPNNLAELLAVRLSAPEHLNLPDFWSMGTLINRDLIITPNHVIADIATDQYLPLLLHFDRIDHQLALQEPQSQLGMVMRKLPEWDLALIEFTASSPSLHDYLDQNITNVFPERYIPSPETPWESFIITPAAPQGIPIRGIVEGLEMIEGIPYLRLRMTEYPRDWEFNQWRGISGAPIVVEGKLQGIVGRMHTSEPVLYALSPREEIGEQWRWEVMEEAIEIVKVPLPSPQIPDAETEFSPEDFLRWLSPAARRAFARADIIRRANREKELYAENLCIALAEDKHDALAAFFSAHDLDAEILISRLITVKNYVIPRAEETADLASLPSLSQQLSEGLHHAQRQAHGRHSREIATWDLLAGLLSVPRSAVARTLNRHGITLESLLQFIDSLPEEQGSPSIAPSDVDSSPVIAGLRNDQVGDTDLLDIRSEAMALASVIAAQDVAPPFSIGLFGEWGSGKTFFMKEMERSIKELVDESKKNETTTPYCTNIVQIWFNSWHYIDTDLWASLTSEIFEGLAASFSPSPLETDGQILQKLIADKRRTTDLLVETTRKMEKAEQELQQNEQQLKQLNSESTRLEHALHPLALAREAARYAANQPEVREKIRMAADAIGDDVMKQNASEVARDLPELLKETSKLRLILSSLGSTRNHLLFLLWMGVVGGIIAAAVLLLPTVIASDFWRVVTGLVASALATYQFIRPIVQGARQALKYFNQANEAREKFIAEEEKNQRADLEARRNEKQQEIDRIQTKVDELQKAITSTTENLKKLNAVALLSDFIGERDKSDDYRKHLGVITKTRNDFERLGTLMKRVREQKPEDLAAHPEMKEFKVDRVVLYIDDLDRCPEERVVEVLQAVHLLLAFDPFIVVVGVDPRWLLRALKQHTKIFEIEEDNSDGIGEQEHSHWHSTPMNYLEKIFQIPFSLRPMRSSGFHQLIDSLAAPLAARNIASNNGDGKEQPEHDGRKIPVADTGDMTSPTPETIEEGRQGEQGEHADPATTDPANGKQQEQASPPDPTKVTTEQGNDNRKKQPTAAAIPKHLRIEQWELEAMKMLYEFIPSPRSAKRFVNIYRLLRTSVPEGRRREFIGNKDEGAHRIALLLLALQTGHPEESSKIIQDLLIADPEQGWWEFIESFRSCCDLPAHADMNGRTRRGAMMSMERWNALFRKLDSFRERIPSFIDERTTCAGFIEWAPAVARYSFHSGRILARGKQETA